MPLPIPMIMENMSNVLVEAKRVADTFEDKPEFAKLREALRKISPDDMKAMLNEVGAVYQSLLHGAIKQYGCGVDPSGKKFQVMALMPAGPFGDRQIITEFDRTGAQEFVDMFVKTLADMKAVNGGLILNG